MQAAAGSRPAGLRVVLHRDGCEGRKPRFHLAGTKRDVQVQLDAPDLASWSPSGCVVNRRPMKPLH
eukprot:612083-Prymnesium_polylepis.1